MASQLARSSSKADPPEYKPIVITAADLHNRDFGEIRWAVDGLIPEGATILAGKPKMGKSWLALNLALAVASGGLALGKIAVEQGEVLYLALEDGPRRLQRRLRKLTEPIGVKAPAALLLTCNWARWNEGGLAALATCLREHPRTRLIIIDTLAKVRSKRVLSDSLYAEDYEAIGTVQSLALEAGVSIMVLTHTRKQPRDLPAHESDPLEEVSGSLGLTGAADAVLVLKRPRHGSEGKLFLTGRDVEERTLDLAWDAASCSWTYLAEANGPLLNGDQQRILAILREAGGSLSVKAIAAEFGASKRYDALAKLVQRMEQDGLLRKTAHGRYTITEGDRGQQTDETVGVQTVQTSK